MTSGILASIEVGDVLPEWVRGVTGVDNPETAIATLSVSGEEIKSSKEVVLETML